MPVVIGTRMRVPITTGNGPENSNWRPDCGILLSVPLLVVDATRMRVLLATRMRVLLVTRMRVPLVTLMIDVDATLTHDVITIYDSHYYSQIQKLN